MSAPKNAETNLFEQQQSFDFGPPRPFVRPALPAERRSVLEVIGRAFHDDPVTCHLFPKEHKRTIRWARFSGLAIKSMGDTAHVLTTDSVQGAAVWQLPNEGRPGALTNCGIAFRFLMLAGLGARRAMRLGDLTSAHRPSEPHYYLGVLGTDPDQQSKGIGSALIQPVLDRCDKERMPAYLESSKKKNLSFYQKHGFEVIDELQIPEGPPIWTMMRRTG